MTILDSDVPVHAALAPTSRPARPYRLHGTVLSVGALMWAGSIALYGADPSDSAVGAMVFGIGSGAFQIAIAGRWTGVSRFWPLVAESWAICVIPTMNIFGQQVAGIVAVVHLLIGYCVLGQIVARKFE